MPRNGSGNFSLAEPAFNPGTPISSTAVNSDFSDIADALTNSLARDGQGGMTAVLPLANTGFTYLTDPNTGMRRTGADTQAIQCGGVDVVTATPTGASVVGTLAVSGPIFSGGVAVPIIPVGAGMLWFGTIAPAKWLLAAGQTLLRTTYADLWAFAQAEIALGSLLFTVGDGSTNFTIVDLSGRVPAGKDITFSRLTAATVLPNGNTLGAISSDASQTVALTTAQLAAHTHVNTLNDPGHTHNAIQATQSRNDGTSTVSLFAFAQNLATSSSTTGVTITNASAGSGAAHSNVQPTLIVNFAIYAGV